MGTPTLITKAITTTPVRVMLDLNTDKGQIKGHVIGHAKIRGKEANKVLGERIQNGEFVDDIDMIREMYDSIEGLGDNSGEITGDAVWDFLATDPLGAYLCPALVQAYFEQYGKARVGNSSASLKR